MDTKFQNQNQKPGQTAEAGNQAKQNKNEGVSPKPGAPDASKNRSTASDKR